MKALSVLGSTGSIGTQTLELAEEFPDRFRVVALTAGNNLDLLVSQIQRHAPEVVALANAERVSELGERLQALEPAARPAKMPELLGALRASAPPPPGPRPTWWLRGSWAALACCPPWPPSAPARIWHLPIRKP